MGLPGRQHHSAAVAMATKVEKTTLSDGGDGGLACSYRDGMGWNGRSGIGERGERGAAKKYDAFLASDSIIKQVWSLWTC